MEEQRKEHRTNKHRLPTTLCKKYKPDFLSKLDRRYKLARELRRFYNAVCADLGGRENLSVIQQVLIERFVWLASIMRGLELEIASADKEAALKLKSHWESANSHIVVLARTLGVTRRAKTIPSLESYLKSKDRKQ